MEIGGPIIDGLLLLLYQTYMLLNKKHNIKLIKEKFQSIDDSFLLR